MSNKLHMSGSGTPKGEDAKKRKGIIIVIIALSVLVIALVGTVAFLLGRAQKNGDAAGNNDGGNGNQREVGGTTRTIIDEGDAEDIVEQMRKEIEEGMFECQMSMTWTFEDGESESKDAYVSNSVNNSHPIYFDVFLEDSEELIYSSPVLTVGSKLTDIKLDKPLPAGTYRAVCEYTLLKDEVSQEGISSARFVIKIVVQK